MPKRTLIMLVLGVVIALGTALSLKSRNSHEAVATTQVLVASSDIPAGTFVRSDASLAMVEWPKENITPAMITNETTTVADFNGSVARRTIAKGETITKNMLVRSSEGGFMSAVLEPGKRAISLAVDATSGNAGFIFPGDHVDLILTHTFGGSNGNNATQQRASETFIQDARVLAVDQSLDNPENKAVLAKTVTLEVTPKQAEGINVAKDLGKISLSLRSLATSPRPVAGKEAAPSSEGAQTASINTLDDVLNANIEAEKRSMATHQQASAGDTSMDNVTRDTDVSRVMSPENGAVTKVLLIRGNERTEIVFGNSAAETQHVPQ